MSITGVPRTDRRVAVVAGVRDAAELLSALARTSAVVAGVVAHEDPASGRAGLAVLTSRARALDVPVLAPRGVTVPMAVEWLRNLALDYLVCTSWNSLLTEEMLRVPRHGTVGMRRPRVLGARRWVAPDWAMLRGETLTGHPMLVLAPGSASPSAAQEVPEDAGRGDGGDRAAAYDRLAEMTSRLLRAELEEVAVRRSAGPGGPTLHPAPSGPPLGLTSFDRTVDDVLDWVAALGHPRPGAFAVMRGETVRLGACEPAGERTIRVPAGTVLGPDGHGIVVTTRTGSLRLVEVQVEGHDPEGASDWFARRGLPPGCAFEPVGWSPLAWLSS